MEGRGRSILNTEELANHVCEDVLMNVVDQCQGALSRKASKK